MVTQLAENIVHFARLLRGAGLQIGADRVLAAIAAVEAVGLDRRTDVHAALSAAILDRHEQQDDFDALFDAFWRDPGPLDPSIAVARPATSVGRKPRPPQTGRVDMALAPPTTDRDREEAKDVTRLRFSDRERLQRADFGTMSAVDHEWARNLAERVPPPVAPVLRRRHERAARGRIDLRRTLQAMARQPHTLTPVYTRPVRELPAIVVLLDVSGSMEPYARVFLHYVHGLMRRGIKVQIFTFGTRLTPITRCLRHRDADLALKGVAEQVPDWNSGTRIASSLDDFSRHWARRVLGGNAAVLLVTDGLDRDAHGALGEAAARLKRSSHQLVWLNPLLRFDGFEPRAAGLRALLPHVDRFLPVHNLASLLDLGRALHEPAVRPATLLH
jgi:uncharacterized protein